MQTLVVVEGSDEIYYLEVHFSLPETLTLSIRICIFDWW